MTRDVRLLGSYTDELLAVHRAPAPMFGVVDKLVKLEAALRAANAIAERSGVDFLSLTFEKRGPEFEFHDDDVRRLLGVSDSDIAAVREESEKQRTRAIAHRVTAHLAFIRRSAVEDRITELQYDAVYGRFLDTHQQFQTDAEAMLGEGILPTDAVFTVEPQEHYLRLRPLPRERQQRLVAIHCEYEAQFTGGGAVPKSTLASIAGLTGAPRRSPRR